MNFLRRLFRRDPTRKALSEIEAQTAASQLAKRGARMRRERERDLQGEVLEALRTGGPAPVTEPWPQTRYRFARIERP